MPLPGVVIGVDVGTVRVGVAASDPRRVLASPVETVQAPGLQRVSEIVAERGAVLVVVGLPTSLSGRATSASATMAKEWAAELAHLVAVPVELVDERLTTVTAGQALRSAGKKGKQARSVIDQAAAVTLLQAVLDRRTGP
jgi:putative Holliday junction resolvase